mmetsp:Transcript_12378/g.29231  ORF Transcript_12378/g.29231 Transcript_12378/m.29231 type:complete len:181 (+) Transcript_12378:1969-2511(+)
MLATEQSTGKKSAGTTLDRGSGVSVSTMQTFRSCHIQRRGNPRDSITNRGDGMGTPDLEFVCLKARKGHFRDLNNRRDSTASITAEEALDAISCRPLPQKSTADSNARDDPADTTLNGRGSRAVDVQVRSMLIQRDRHGEKVLSRAGLWIVVINVHFICPPVAGPINCDWNGRRHRRKLQ